MFAKDGGGRRPNKFWLKRNLNTGTLGTSTNGRRETVVPVQVVEISCGPDTTCTWYRARTKRAMDY